jgi:predicted esterase
LAVGCGREQTASQQSLGTAPNNWPVTLLDAAAKGEAPSSTPLKPLAGYPWLITLGKAGTGEDVATPPLGATEPRPIVVAIHGAGDRPDWACGGWRIGVEAYPFVVCPVGQPMGNQRYGWANAHAITTAIERSLEALRTRFDGYCSSAPMVYVGFSQGAALAARVLIDNAQRFPTVVLAEGGYDFVSEFWFSRKFFEAGGRRVLLLCGTPGCFAAASRASKTMLRAGLKSIVAGDGKAGHNLNGLMQRAIREHWSELVTDVVGWETYKEHRWPLVK